VSLYAPAPTFAGLASGALRLRAAQAADAAVLAAWDREPHVIACSTDDPAAEVAFGGVEWAEEIAAASPDSFHLIAELEQADARRPIGAMQVCDPEREPTHYWGTIEPGLRAVDIWIGPKEMLGRGHGTTMMTLVIDACFADPAVKGIIIDPLNSNTAAHRFYQRLGFVPAGRRSFDADDCLVHRLSRADWEARG
jgi:aminoglycoside 6'-N-acetyltransferase